MRRVLFMSTLLLAACDASPPPQPRIEAPTNATEPHPYVQQQQPSILEHMAGAAVAGAAAGSAGAVAHNMTNRAMHHVAKRRRAARIKRR